MRCSHRPQTRSRGCGPSWRRRGRPRRGSQSWSARCRRRRGGKAEPAGCAGGRSGDLLVVDPRVDRERQRGQIWPKSAEVAPILGVQTQRWRKSGRTWPKLCHIVAPCWLCFKQASAESGRLPHIGTFSARVMRPPGSALHACTTHQGGDQRALWGRALNAGRLASQTLGGIGDASLAPSVGGAPQAGRILGRMCRARGDRPF